MTSAEKIVKVFRALAQNPTVTGARILRSSTNPETTDVTVVSTWCQRNLERGKSLKFQQTHVAELSSKKVVEMLPVDISNELMSAVSKTGKYRAVIRDCPPEGSATQRKQYLEIWQSHSLYRNFDLAAFEVHGEVYVDDEFGSLEFSPDETKLLFIAEEKQPKAEPFYKQKPQKNEGKENKEKENSSENGAAPEKGEEYTFRQDWGELLVGKHRPVIVICDIFREKFNVPEGQPGGSIGQVKWTPDGLGVVGVVCTDSPRRLGITYCTNRKSSIFHMTMDGQTRILSVDGVYKEGLSVRSPRFSPDGNYLIWMERTAGGPHHACHSLVLYYWNRDKNDTVIGVVESSVGTTTSAVFYGLYNQRLPKRCWSSDSRRVLFHTPQNCRNLPFMLNIMSGHITPVNMPPGMESQGSLAILDVHDDVVVAVVGSLRTPSSLVVGHLRPTGQEVFNVVWTPLTEAPDAGPELYEAKVEYLALEHKNQDKVRNFSAIYFGPLDDDKPKGSLPLILCPHGGPNACYTDDFSLTLALMVALGYGVLLVNFRGSTGQGQASIDFLLGRIGDTDVKDCQLARDEALAKFPALSKSKCVLFGGSHGGFVVAHLSAQYPSDYRAVVARNPVMNIPPMLSFSDIPDWAIVNAANVEYDMAGYLDKDTLEKMRKCSPIEVVSQVKAPTLLMLGKKDLRVPPLQALEYHYALRDLGVKTKVHMYDDTHQLSQVPNEIDNVINSLLWFEEHLDN